MSEVIELNDLDISTIPLNSLDSKPSTPKSTASDTQPSVNFGSGVELLMNEKVKISSDKTTDINISDLNNLENELNSLTKDTLPEIKSVPLTPKSDLFKNNLKKIEIPNDKIQLNKENLNLGTATANTTNTNENDIKNWEFNNIPINPDKVIENKLSPEEILADKFSILRNLESLEAKGVKLTKKYTMDSNYYEMKGEYDLIISEKEKSNSVKFQGKMLMAAITGIEFLNNRFDPFDVKLDGWSEQLNENIDDYDEIFGELHEKYKSKATMAPELKLVFQLGASGMMLHMTNTMFKSAMPGMDDIMRQNPELAEQFTRAAVDSMSSNSPGFSGFMNNMMNDNGTQNNNFENMNIPPSNNRPDLNASKQEVDIEREDMKGPSDISSLLNNLKPKTNIRVDDDVESTISIEDLKEISNKKMPKSVSKKRRSSQNTVSLDI